MNNSRRKELTKISETLHLLEEGISNLQMEEEESFDNLPEGIQESERGQQMEENAYELDEIANEMEELRERIDEIINK